MGRRTLSIGTLVALGACAAMAAGCGSLTSINNSGSSDSGMTDSGMPDAGMPDSGMPDAGMPDSGYGDAGMPDSGIVATGITITPATASVPVGQSTQLSAVFTPPSTTNQSVTWASSDMRIVTVDSKGAIHGVEEGPATISAKSLDGSNVTSTSVTVTVTPAVWLPTTFAGSISGDAGYVNAMGTAALFDLPYGLAFDSKGSLYVADSNNNRIRKIAQDGSVTSPTGTGDAQDSVSAEGEFRLGNPRGVIFDTLGNLYVADFGSHRIAKITPEGFLTGFAGNADRAADGDTVDGTGSMARFKGPAGITVDSSGNLYVVDFLDHVVRKIDPDAGVTTLAGSKGMTGDAGGNGTAARFDYPGGIAVDSQGNLYVVDGKNHQLRKITSLKDVTRFAGSGINGSADGLRDGAQFSNPQGITIDSRGNLYVADTYNNAIRKVSPMGTVNTLAMTEDAGFFGPRGIVIDSQGDLYVSDTSNHRIVKLTVVRN